MADVSDPSNRPFPVGPAWTGRLSWPALSPPTLADPVSDKPRLL